MDQPQFKQMWLDAVAAKRSILCVGFDPAPFGQRKAQVLSAGTDKLDFCIKLIRKVAPYAAAIKANHQYFRDIGREGLMRLTREIHLHDMVAIDDSKVCDIGDTNDSAFYHIAAEGFDATTYAPFAGNISEALASAHSHGLGLITLVLMSNPEFQVMKTARLAGESGSCYFAKEVARLGGQAVVVGAPSPANHIAVADLELIAGLCPDQLVLVPGLGAQGGGAEALVGLFGKRVIANVGREIFYAPDPGACAAAWRDRLWREDFVLQKR